ncbi:MAG: DUF998 domain-containing protein [Candidatus Bathyarchaeota archaeon]|nr:DUF998 domain-containing protein [Candidatus Bathyarchaeota archaeon]
MAGGFLFVGSVQFLLFLIIAESLYPGYSVSENYISDLGVGTTSLVFNSSVFLLGVTVVAGAYFFQCAFDSKLLSILFAITGLGAMGVGLFPENFGILHAVASLVTFLFGGLSAIMSYKLQSPPLSYFSVLLGVLSLAALALFGSSTYLGIGKGGMERMIAYPALLWAVGFGSYLLSYSKKTGAATKS